MLLPSRQVLPHDQSGTRRNQTEAQLRSFAQTQKKTAQFLRLLWVHVEEVHTFGLQDQPHLLRPCVGRTMSVPHDVGGPDRVGPTESVKDRTNEF